MKGVGGPLLCIGDLLSDLEEKDDLHQPLKEASSPSSSSLPDSTDTLQSSVDLTNLFQENYGRLNEAFARTDHSWTSLTLKLCTSLETANELVQSTNSNVMLLSEKVEELEKIVKRGDSAVAAAKAVHVSMNQKGDVQSSPPDRRTTGGESPSKSRGISPRVPQRAGESRQQASVLY